ncbi:hypothetical protein BGX27_002356 [Mortierella sp. AM989]|nr:hypothetical protein BGX27_002356 [Mortierella sp. AM989]
MSKSVHPFKNATHIPNNFYFQNTNPQRYDAGDYFKPFSDLHTSKKAILHDYWNRSIKILLSSSIPKFHNTGGRLSTIWKTSDKGLGEFWKQQEQSESAEDDLQTTTSMVRKRSYRSVRHHISQAFRAVDDRTIYDSGSSKRRCQSAWLMGSGELAGRVQKQQEGQDGEQLDGDENDKEDEEYEEEQDDNSSESEESASQSSEGSEYLPSGAKLPPAVVPASIYYPTGNGSTDCSEELWTPWIVEGEDLAGKAWIALNHIYLFDIKDTSSSLYEAIGAKHWAAITSLSLKKLLSNDSIGDLASYAIDLSQMRYSDAQDSTLDWIGNRDVKKVLNHLLADDFLRKSPDFNELEMVKHVFDPFLKTFISSIQSGVGRWDKTFLPSQERKKDALTEIEGGLCAILFEFQFQFGFEFDSNAHKPPVKHKDSNGIRLGALLKDAIDSMAKQGVDVTMLKVFGMVVVGVEGELFSMQLVARGIYLMKHYAVLHAPRSQYDFGVVAGTTNTFLNLKEELIATMDVCRESRLDRPIDWTQPSFGTPIKVNPTGISKNFPGSPSLRQAILQTTKK